MARESLARKVRRSQLSGHHACRGTDDAGPGGRPTSPTCRGPVSGSSRSAAPPRPSPNRVDVWRCDPPVWSGGTSARPACRSSGRAGGTTLVIRGPWGAARGRAAGDVTAAHKAGEMPCRPFGITRLRPSAPGSPERWARRAADLPHNTLPPRCGAGVARIATALLTWRGSRLAAPAFVAALGLLLPLFSYIFPGGQFLLFPWFVITFLFAALGCGYLRTRGPTA